ncbi:SMC-Scp complex subunit ScpB [Granulicatella seriolae]|uniref:Segregation and condensation protein B n=1 Tax=Granulicatella seriolae TaxID=2967226 RepID=A0ABT1WP49_9LACT|nr:SMC-Scp complex subunit ScpB [Granulicatella seriolae]
MIQVNEASIQALLYVAGDEGLSVEQLSYLLEIDKAAVRQWMDKLQERLASDEDSGLHILLTANEYKLVTKNDYEELIRRYAISPYMSQISPAALEVLAIIAYKQPITRMEIDAIRGVQSSGSIQKLQIRDLIEEAGRVESPGRPKLYKTSKYFLDYMGLESLEQLPEISDLFDLSSEETQELFKGSELEAKENE